MSDLFENHIDGFSTRRLIYVVLKAMMLALSLIPCIMSHSTAMVGLMKRGRWLKVSSARLEKPGI